MNITEIAYSAAKVPGVKWLLKPLYYRFKEYRQRKVIENFKSYGMSVIKEFDEIMTANNFHYFLIFGSMLGAVREHGLIKHDLDLDTAMWYEDYNDNLLPTLEKAGFKLEHSFVVDGGKNGMEWTLVKNGVSVDIFFVYPAINENPYCCDFPFSTEETDCVSWNQLMRKYGGVQPRRVELPFTKEYVRVPFEKFMLPIPINADEILAVHYGKDYMISIKNWVRDEKKEPAKHLVMWKDKLAIFTEFNK